MLRRDPFADLPALIRSVYAYVAYRVGDGPEAEDVTSDVFERALRYRDRFDPRRGEPIAWLVGIARRCIADAFAARPESAGEPPDAPAPGDVEDETVRRLELRAAVGQLAERERELIALRYGADLTVRQIAELLEERTNTIEVALHRALKRLRTLLQPEEAGESAVRIPPSSPVYPASSAASEGGSDVPHA